MILVKRPLCLNSRATFDDICPEVETKDKSIPTGFKKCLSKVSPKGSVSPAKVT